jgi:hypothetical protein
MASQQGIGWMPANREKEVCFLETSALAFGLALDVQGVHASLFS